MQELKAHLITDLKLEDITVDDIENDTPLFIEGLQLDSIDALEIVVILDRNYGVKVHDEETGRRVMQSVSTLADFILEEQGKNA